MYVSPSAHSRLSVRLCGCGSVPIPKAFWLFISYALMVVNFVYESHIKDYNCIFLSNSFNVLLFFLHLLTLEAIVFVHTADLCRFFLHMNRKRDENARIYTNSPNPHICYSTRTWMIANCVPTKKKKNDGKKCTSVESDSTVYDGLC